VIKMACPVLGEKSGPGAIGPIKAPGLGLPRSPGRDLVFFFPHRQNDMARAIPGGVERIYGESPTAREVTPSPRASTTAPPSWPGRTAGNNPSGSLAGEGG